MNKYKLKDFLPLISIFSSVVGLTLIKCWYSDSYDLHFAMNGFMAFFFLVFGAFKFANLSAFATAYAKYDLIAKHSHPYALAYPFIELTLGLAYLTSFAPFYTNLTAFILMVIGAAGVANELRKGNEFLCACLGTLFTVPMTYVTLAEDLLMAAMALYMLL